MNFEFIIDGRKTRDEVVKFRGMGIADEEIVHYKGEGGGVSVVAEEHGVSEKPCWDRRAIRRSWDKSLDWGRQGTVFKTSQKKKGLPLE
jgi:hypothetical protein